MDCRLFFTFLPQPADSADFLTNDGDKGNPITLLLFYYISHLEIFHFLDCFTLELTQRR